ncbi:MAG: methyltransferase domain-containing protein [Clostridia bacterium]|nr:methyltransferase domain-containing protein [Clostridia bacterium]
MWWRTLLRCPVCGGAVQKEGNSLYCNGARRHCFDFAKEGYVNLASSKAAGGGDDAALIAARTAFLSAGHYAPFADRLCALLQRYAPGGTVVDAGCGEGYYSCRMAADGHGVLGIDLSKNGVKHGARTAKTQALSALFAVGGIFDLPVADAAADAVVSLFAPVCESEFLRVLKPGGILVLAGAGPDHLFDLKKAIYDTPYRNEPRADAPIHMEKLHDECLRFEMRLDATALTNLFAMTPYFYRTSAVGRERLAALQELCVGAEMDIAVYRKGENGCKSVF